MAVIGRCVGFHNDKRTRPVRLTVEVSLPFQSLDVVVDRSRVQPESLANLPYRWGESARFTLIPNESEDFCLS